MPGQARSNELMTKDAQYCVENLFHLVSDPLGGMLTGPLNIGGKARWKFLKIWLICTDKNQKFHPKCSVFSRIAHLASKNPENIWIGPLGL
jgi:hypothetical protein